MPVFFKPANIGCSANPSVPSFISKVLKTFFRNPRPDAILELFFIPVLHFRHLKRKVREIVAPVAGVRKHNSVALSYGLTIAICAVFIHDQTVLFVEASVI